MDQPSSPEDSSLQDKAMDQPSSPATGSPTPDEKPCQDDKLPPTNQLFESAWASSADEEEDQSATGEYDMRSTLNIPMQYFPRLERRNTERASNQSSHRRRQAIAASPDKNSNHSTSTFTNDSKHQPQQPPGATLSDQVFGTLLGAAKLAGGVTLSATGQVMAPPLALTRSLLLPALWDAIVFVLQENVPLRALEWWRVVSTTVSQAVRILINTPVGEQARGRLLAVISDIVKIITSVDAQRLLMDTSGTIVQLGRVLDSEPFHKLFSQLALVLSRTVTLLASGHTLELVHHLDQLGRSVSKLLAAPQTTVAIAHVTATIVRALQLEQSSLSTPLQRRERNEQQANLNQGVEGMQTLSLEEVILESIGVSTHTTASSSASSSVPSRIVCNDDDDSSKKATSVDWDDQSSLRQRVDESTTGGTEHSPYQRTNVFQDDVNLHFLRESILDANGGADENDKNSRELESLVDGVELKAQKTNGTKPDDDTTAANDEGHNPVQHFYQILQESLQQQANELEQRIRERQQKEQPKDTANKKANVRAVSTECDESSNQDSLTQISESIRQLLRKQYRREPVSAVSLLSIIQQLDNVRRQYPRELILLIGVIAFFVLLWTFLGCYGLYTIFVRSTNTVVVTPSDGPSLTNEIIVRIQMAEDGALPAAKDIVDHMIKSYNGPPEDSSMSNEL